MSDNNIDFEGNPQENPDPKGSGAAATGNENNDANQPDSVDINTGNTADINSNQNNQNPNDDTNKKPDNKDANQNSNNSEEVSLEAGTKIEFDGTEYTVDNNGNIVDEKGNVFKEAKDVKQWLDENNAVDESNDSEEITIKNLQEHLGAKITDAKGNQIEFENSPAGVKAYVESVINLRSDEIRQGTINKFYNDNPLVKQFIDYVKINGTPKGFGELPDRTGIEIDKDNEAQQEAIIRMAGFEFGNKTINENYIKYLKSTGGLYDEAKVQLEALQNKDKAVRKDLEVRAAAAREEERKDLEMYFNKVYNMISNRKIGDYILPENITKEKNGQKITLTLNDFYDYVAVANEVDDENRSITAYVRDLNNQSDDELLAKELIDAWLMFTGGSYKDLVDMIAKQDNVRKLVIKSKENRNKNSIQIKKPIKAKSSIDDIVF